ncbi:hypothetical protein TPADAL_0001a [Treponema pallidum subsp. pallidum DAL-1]|uniref:Secreted protein n=2 Tax=Treponema pallidum TaxID=160 RepID=A0AAU8RM39_TREPL|nr:hypothetical protein TPESAMD_0001a [Treponema pallidum subsp. pertenue str. SamoaD]AEZ58187.1 hypothetical protein TPECDC2_0001a [Treponema pallidum subsp. pertenue str. CDC2]AEZ59255.1 hypothetical protein TPEGAU_0001a [Treponema pallidum subsp. pertenue str. Gauthier]AEZ60323.1 hypothetical protein TPADAL_0001a [Treponema pallidum subsp. pallidum DAL-1]AGK83644.1 hypothetical protein TPFB_0001a [Treponema pallidum str. Fribourg-Blanc]AJB40019.1 hypothetical protein TENDBA_0001a [Treponema
MLISFRKASFSHRIFTVSFLLINLISIKNVVVSHNSNCEYLDKCLCLENYQTKTAHKLVKKVYFFSKKRGIFVSKV